LTIPVTLLTTEELLDCDLFSDEEDLLSEEDLSLEEEEDFEETAA
jgi:hypothetical protein